MGEKITNSMGRQFDILLKSKPFQPFQICMADGESVVVKSPEFAWHPPGTSTIFVAGGDEAGLTHIIELELVTRFTRERKTSGVRKGAA